MTATTIRVQMAQRKDTAANWTAANPILLSGEIGYETDTEKFKIGDGTTNWNGLAYLPIPDGSGNLTITGNLEIGTTGTLTFEGSTADGFETTLAVTDPTADRTITLPDVSGTVVTTGDTGSVTSTMIADGTIVDADVSATAEIAVSKLANGTANQVLVTDGTDVSWSDDLTLAGNLTVNGTTTTVNTQTLVVEDKNIELGVVGTPTDLTADGGGITLKGATDKTINWVDATDSWTSSEHVDLASGKSYRINGTEVLSSTALGSGVTGSSLTSVGTISSGTWQGTAIDAAYLDSTVVTTGDTGTVTSTMIADGTIVDGDINASAAIAGTKISPDFGSQNVVTTGTSTAASFIPSSSTVPTNGVYLPSANSVAISTNGTGRLFVDASGNVGVATSPTRKLSVNGVAGFGNGTIETIISFSDRGIFGTASNHDLELRTNNSEKLRITSDGKVGLGTSSPATNLEVYGAQGTILEALRLRNQNAGVAGVRQTFWQDYLVAAFTASRNGLDGRLSLQTTDTSGNLQDRLYIDGSGRVGVGTTSPGGLMHLKGDTNNNGAELILAVNNNNTTDNIGAVLFGNNVNSSLSKILSGTSGNSTSSYLTFSTSASGTQSEAMRIDSSGRLLVGTSSASLSNKFLLQGDTSSANNGGYMRLQTANSIVAGTSLGSIGFGDSANNGALIEARGDVSWSPFTKGSRLEFSTTADGASSPTERLRITSAGVLQIADAGNIAVGTTTGTKIGTATTQKLGFFNKTPVVQPAAVADATDAASVITQLNALLARMRDLGLIAT